jgi:glycine cleavage system H protein
MAGKIPKSGTYSEGRLWFRRTAGVITLGITPDAADELDKIDELELPDDGDDFDKGDLILSIAGTKGALDVTAPAAGFITEINEALHEDPSSVIEDPEEEGWLVKLEIQDTSDLEEYQPEEDDEEEDRAP